MLLIEGCIAVTRLTGTDNRQLFRVGRLQELTEWRVVTYGILNFPD